MKTMFRLSFGQIKEYEVSKETPATVSFFHPGRARMRCEHKKAGSYSWHESWEAAKAHQINTIEREIKHLSAVLARAEIELKEVMGWQKPEQQTEGKL